MKKIFLILFVTIVTNAYAQKDIYYVNKNRDTVFCKDLYLSQSTFGNKSKFKLDATTIQKIKNKLELTEITNIQGYFSTELYSTDLFGKGILTQLEIHNIPELNSKNPLPLKILAENNGKKLLLYIQKFAGNPPTYNDKYFYRDGENLIALDKSNYKEKLKNIFSDCSSIMNKLNGDKKYFNDIDDLVEEYNKCINKKIIKNK